MSAANDCRKTLGNRKEENEQSATAEYRTHHGFAIQREPDLPLELGGGGGRYVAISTIVPDLGGIVVEGVGVDGVNVAILDICTPSMVRYTTYVTVEKR